MSTHACSSPNCDCDRWPEPGTTVDAVVHNIAEMGVYCHLPAYGNKEAMVPFSEMSTKRIRSVNRMVKVGDAIKGLVLRVVRDKGYIDLSKRRADEIMAWVTVPAMLNRAIDSDSDSSYSDDDSDRLESGTLPI